MKVTSKYLSSLIADLQDEFKVEEEELTSKEIFAISLSCEAFQIPLSEAIDSMMDRKKLRPCQSVGIMQNLRKMNEEKLFNYIYSLTDLDTQFIRAISKELATRIDTKYLNPLLYLFSQIRNKRLEKVA